MINEYVLKIKYLTKYNQITKKIKNDNKLGV